MCVCEVGVCELQSARGVFVDLFIERAVVVAIKGACGNNLSVAFAVADGLAEWASY